MHLEWLYERMAEVADRPAIVWRDEATTYAELLRRRAAWNERLDAQGVQPGQIVAIVGDYSPNACALLLALVDRGALVVPLTGATSAHHAEFLQVGQVETLVRFNRDDAWQIEAVESAEPIHPLLAELRRRATPGLVLYSSGSTGKSKAAVHDFGRILEKFTVTRQRLVTLTFLLFDHMGGLNTLFYALSNGGTVVATEHRDPEAVCDLVERHRIELLPASPTFLSLLLISGAHRRYDLSSLRLVTYGTEVMPQTTLDRLRAELPGVKLQQTYGLSELGVLRSKSREDGSLWVKVGGEGVETKVVDGILWIRSRSAMLGYLNAPSPFDAEGWMNTQDQVEVDGEYIKILGRVTDIINVGGNKVYPAEVESVLLELDNVRDVTVFGEANAITGHLVAARVVLDEPEPLDTLTRRMRVFARDRLARYKIPVRLEIASETAVSARYKKVRTR
ncbi:MAG: long-chain fatty acid--CoA ligase [Chloroflexi bacterium]|nr:long-chain fatty acid--CoA ligase [Chloroflexota bacterium]